MSLNYIYPGSGTTPANGAQAAQSPRQVVQAVLGTADTTFTLTHNWNFDTAALARLCPQVSVLAEAAAAGALTIDSRTANTIVFDGTITLGGTWEITLDQPHSIIMPND